jgi:hypothetical protein
VKTKSDSLLARPRSLGRMVIELTNVHACESRCDGNEPLSSNVSAVLHVLFSGDLLETLVDLIEYSNELNPTFSIEFRQFVRSLFRYCNAQVTALLLDCYSAIHSDSKLFRHISPTTVTIRLSTPFFDAQLIPLDIECSQTTRYKP